MKVRVMILVMAQTTVPLHDIKNFRNVLLKVSCCWAKVGDAVVPAKHYLGTLKDSGEYTGRDGDVFMSVTCESEEPETPVHHVTFVYTSRRCFVPSHDLTATEPRPVRLSHSRYIHASVRT